MIFPNALQLSYDREHLVVRKEFLINILRSVYKVDIVACKRVRRCRLAGIQGWSESGAGTLRARG